MSLSARFRFAIVSFGFVFAGGRKVGKNQSSSLQPKVVRTISVKDVVAVLEREPQMSKSTLMYRLIQ